MAIKLICDRCGKTSPDKRDRGLVTIGRFKLDIAVSEPLRAGSLPCPDGHLCEVCFEQVLDLIRAALNSKRT